MTKMVSRLEPKGGKKRDEAIIMVIMLIRPIG